MAYFYKGLPFLILGAIVVLSAPWLALIALMVAVVVLPSLAFAIVFVPFMLVRNVYRRRQHAPNTEPLKTLVGDEALRVAVLKEPASQPEDQTLRASERWL